MGGKKLTVFQRLNNVFGPDGINVPKDTTNRYSIGNDALIKTKDKDAYDRAKLQAQQNKYLGGMWRKVDGELFQQSIHYETTRIGSYTDFEAMEFYPEISAALDIMMEECLAASSVIPLLDGTEYTVKELHDKGVTNFWTYGVDIKSNKIKPSKIDRVVLKGEKDIFKIILDDGTELLSTDNHKWLSNDGLWVETKSLKYGDSLKTISRKLDYKGYEKVSLTNFKGDTKLTHIIVAESENIEDKKRMLLDEKSNDQKIVVHHKSFNKLNNNPNELEYMFWDDHQKLHTDLNKEKWSNDDFRVKMSNIFSKTAKKTWDKLDTVNKKLRIEKLHKGLNDKLNLLDDKVKKEFLNRGGEHNGMFGVRRFGKDNPNYDYSTKDINNINELEYINFITNTTGNRRLKLMKKFNLNKFSVIKYNKYLCEKYGLVRIEDLDFSKSEGFNIKLIKNFISDEKYPYRSTKKYCKNYNINPTKLTSFLNKKGYKNWSDVVDTIGNHRVISVEHVGVESVYDLVNASADNSFGVKCNSGMVISHNCTTTNDKGRMLNVYSDSKRVKTILEDLFFNRLDIHTSLPMWTRNTPIRENSIIPLLDGTEVTIKELSNRIKNGEDIWSYAIQDDTKSIVPSKIIWCDLTRKDSELYRVTLDDGTHVDTTPDHEYMLRDGSFKRADSLTVGQSLMPFYSKKEKIKNSDSNGYEKVFNPNSNKFEFTHRVVVREDGRDLSSEKKEKSIFVSHHVDFNKLNNNPSNLLRMKSSDHTKLHNKMSEIGTKVLKRVDVVEKRMSGIDKYLRSDARKKRLSEEMKGVYPTYFQEYNSSDLHTEHNEIRSEKMLENWGSNEFIKKTKKEMTIEITDECLKYITNLIISSETYVGVNKLADLLKNDKDFIKLFKIKYTLRKDIQKSINTTTLKKVIFRKTGKNYFDYVISIKPSLVLDKSYAKAKSIYLGKTKEKSLLNHKVVSVIKLDETSDVYCLEAVGPNGEDDRHNFPVCGKDVTGSTSRSSGVFLMNCKYGDNFVFLNIDDKAGVMGVRQLPNFEIERREGDLYNRLLVGRSPSGGDDTDENKVKFYWRGKDVEFNSWQIAHFRLLGDDRRLPYGTSVLEKGRRIWKQLLLSEDAMLIYRITRAPERRVYKIYVGNIDDEDVPAYVDEIANRFKRTPIMDAQTGQIDLKYNQMANDQDFFIPVRSEDAPNPIDTLAGACVALDTKIPLLDGRTLELNEIISEWDGGNRNLWVYSCDPKTGAVAPGMITWAGETRQDAEVLKITLDNGESITTTPDHKWVHRTKGFIEAQDLVEGDSLMPFYRDTKKIKANTNEYERVWDSAKKEWIFTHRMVTDYFTTENDVIKEFIFDKKYTNKIKNIRHHKDHDRFNNNPNNLVFMNGGDHMKYHQSVIMKTIWANPEENIKKIRKGINKFINNQTDSEREIRGKQSRINSINSRNKSNETFNNNPNKSDLIKLRGNVISITKSTDDFKESFSIIAKNNWRSKEYRDKVFSKKQTITFTDELYNMFLGMFKLNGKADLTLIELNNSIDFINEFKSTNKDIRSSMANLNEFTRNHLDKMLKKRGFKNYREWCKVTAEELGYKNVRAWRYYIEKENKLSNIEVNYNHKIVNIERLKNRINTGTITVDGDEKYHNYHTFACESGVYIKNSNLDQIADIEYLQRKLFTALRVPKSFLGFDEPTGEGKNLALQDIRFTRTVNRIQQSMIQELNKVAILHLFLLGLEDELDNFTLTLNNPSTQAEMLKVEHMSAKVALFKDAVSDAGNGFGVMSMTRGKREIMGWSDDEIKQDLLEQRLEKAAAAEMENTSNVIKHTGMFDQVDRVYGDIEAAKKGGQSEDGEDGEGGGDAGGGGFGGGGMGGLDFGEGGDEGDDGLDFDEDEGGAEGGDDGLDFGEGGDDGDGELGVEPDATEETFKRMDNLIIEQKNKLSARKKKYKNIYSDKLINSIIPTEKEIVNERVKFQDKNLKINENINSMINDIDKMLDE